MTCISGHCIVFHCATKEHSRCYYIFEALLGESYQAYIAFALII